MKAFAVAGLLVAGFLGNGAVHAEGSPVIPSNARIYVEADGGFDISFTAALEKRHVPLIVTMDKSTADYALESSVRLVELKSGNVVFACALDTKSTHSRQSSADACAKRLGTLIGAPYTPHTSAVKMIARHGIPGFTKEPAFDF